MKILITGGAGFIGSYLSEELLKKGEEVYVIDDLSTGSIYNIECIKNYHKFHFVIDSVMNYPVLAELVNECDIVFHLAAFVGVKLIVDNPMQTLDTNIGGTQNVLKAAQIKNKLVILTSSSEVYGKSTKLPFSEDDDMVFGPTIKHRWSYACSKAVDEFLGLACYKQRSLPVIIVRLFNTIGPRQTGRYGMVVPRFVKQALSGLPLTVYDTGKQTRCFCYVGDVVRALIDLSGKQQAIGQVFNIGSKEEISILNVAKRIIKLSESKSKIEFMPYEEAYEEGYEDMFKRVPDISKIHKIIGFVPKVDLDSALKMIIGYYRSNNNRE